MSEHWTQLELLTFKCVFIRLLVSTTIYVLRHRPDTISLTIYLFDNYISLVTSSPSMISSPSSSSSSSWVFYFLSHLFFYSIFSMEVGNWFFDVGTQLIDIWFRERKKNIVNVNAPSKRAVENTQTRAIILFLMIIIILCWLILMASIRHWCCVELALESWAIQNGNWLGSHSNQLCRVMAVNGRV